LEPAPLCSARIALLCPASARSLAAAVGPGTMARGGTSASSRCARCRARGRGGRSRRPRSAGEAATLGSPSLGDAPQGGDALLAGFSHRVARAGPARQREARPAASGVP